VMSGTFYQAVQKPSVEVVTDAIERIEANGVRTRDGSLHEIDLLVLATGFDAHAYLRPMTVRGEGGVALEEVWRDLPLTYRSVAIPHMPNLFLINGPYSPGGTASVVGIVEVQADYVMQLIDRALREDVALVPREAAARDWLDAVRARAAGSVWGTGGCKSWYLDATGTPTIDPTPLSELTEQLAAPITADWEARPRATVRAIRAA
jgi:cation diffusion facilitator CzcD-associated flavoprotein CzcO